MELSFEQQSTAFLYSLPLGAALGVIYGILKLIRFALSPKKHTVIALDIAFMLLCSLSIFFYSLGMLDGYIRIYVIIGASTGFFIYRLTVGKLLQRILDPIIRVIKKIIVSIFTKIKLFTKKLLKIGYEILYNICGRIVLYIKRLLSTNSNRNKSDKYGKRKNRKRSVGAYRRAEGRAGRRS